MAVVNMSQAVWDAYVAFRNGYNGSMVGKTGREGVVADLLVGDVLLGGRGEIVAIDAAGSATSTTARNMTVEVREGRTAVYSWPNNGPIRFAR